MSARSDGSKARRLVLGLALVATLWASWRVSGDDPTPGHVEARNDRGVSKPLARAPAQTLPTEPLRWNHRAAPPAAALHPSGDLFAQPAPTRAAEPPRPQSPVPPALKYLGRLAGAQGVQVYLLDSRDELLVAGVGHQFGGGWVLQSIGKDRMALRHAASGQEHIMAMGALE